MQKLTSFFWYCSGADPELLKKCPTESSKYVGIGATVFFTGVFAALAAGYSLYTVFDNYIAATIFGILWGLMIFNLDRFIVSSMRKEKKASREILMATPRIVLAILISIVIAKPLELKIFDKEIQPELIVMEQQKYAVQESHVKARFDATQDSISAEIQRLKSEIAAQQSKRDELVRIAQEEADGTGGSRRRNLGPIYKVKKADADNAERELVEITRNNSARIFELQKSYDRNEGAIQREINSIERAKMNGPAARIEALDRLAKESSAIWWAHWFIVLLFIAIETSPVFVKLISGKGPYDNLLRIAEHNFEATEIEELAKTNAGAKERSATLPQHERAYITEELDASLKRS
ncbi:MAG TPA: DUF4407 domain-containing protein [Chryseosolibacter sp.]|nr:DUF4407 domain-containing protein [Chryseosolibacter sp.]